MNLTDEYGNLVGSITATSPLFYDTVFRGQAKEIIRIAADGRIYWNGREVEGDDDFRAAMRDLSEHFKGRHG